MASNQYINKVEYGGNTLIDLTSDTVTADKVLSGYTAHNAAGATITGNIVTKSSSDITLIDGTVTVPAGYYSSAVEHLINSLTLTAPSSGTRSFYVTLPNGANDTITLIFEVDASGNSSITDDAIPATGVSF